MIKITIILSILGTISACQSTARQDKVAAIQIDTINGVKDSVQVVNEPKSEVFSTLFDRSEIKTALAVKKANKEDLIVHLYIPLCDNEHQGIVPTSKSLGDGMSIRTNLYWATSGGTKAYFKKLPDWKLRYDELDIDSNVLERMVFEKEFEGQKVYLIADAYRGDRMEETINNYLSAISGAHKDSILLNNNTTIVAAGNADMVMFNGHNGMMDAIHVQDWPNVDGKQKDIVMNACVSYGYLQNEFMKAGGYPLVRTNTLLYPGAYVLDQIIKDWVNGVDEKQLCLNAGRTYCQKHDCGAGTKVYKTGW
ncbi:hypothetical protein [Crocinitomix catalasitica]|uniref:hypothetical protein n=1 Tax=Crocinitomix catalasitica TaxID=184607 RepID=UPI0004800EF2|nr:hypothetical protein [Crocinitomix catalasitica]